MKYIPVFPPPFTNQTVLITGGTGSFGNAMVKKLLTTSIDRIRILSRDELKQDNMKRAYGNDPRLRFFLGDVRDISTLEQAMDGAHFVFSAAALKQVPNCEYFPIEAVKTNVLGSENVMNSAIKYGVSKVIVLSTDKSVYPINTMGMTKALMEKLMLAKAYYAFTKKVTLCGTRYGNVMSSRGSVIPLFVEQIKQGIPLTITDPNMTRFMMPLEIAVDLVLFAFANGFAGDIFVHKAPAATIGDLAQVMLDIFKSNAGTTIVGVRPGEKKHETLVSGEELYKAEDMQDYYRIPMGVTTGYIDTPDYTSENTHRLSLDELRDMLINLDYIKEALK